MMTNAAASVPAHLPGEHFAAALFFFVLGSAALILIREDLAQGHFFVPRVVATVHLFTLGWLMLSIFGALTQFLPVAIGVTIRSNPLAHVSFALHCLGTAGFVFGMGAGQRTVLLVGAALAGTAFLLFALNMALTLASSKQRGVTWWALAGANVFLVITPIYGILLALNLSQSFVQDRFHHMARHIHVAVVGVVLMVVVGVAHKLLPMFLLSHGAKDWAAKVAAGLFFSSALILSVPFGGHPPAYVALGLALAGLVALAWQARDWYRNSRRSSLDPGLHLAATGIVGMCIAGVLAPIAFYFGMAKPHLLVAYHLCLLGALSLFVAGHYFKIVPFLVWNHKFGPLLGKKKVPTVAQLYSAKQAQAIVLLLGIGLAALLVSVLLQPWLGTVKTSIGIAIGGSIFTLGALFETSLIARVARRKPE